MLQVPFFTGCILYNFFPGHMSAAGPAMLRFLVFAGALLQVLPPPSCMSAGCCKAISARVQHGGCAAACHIQHQT